MRSTLPAVADRARIGRRFAALLASVALALPAQAVWLAPPAAAATVPCPTGTADVGNGICEATFVASGTWTVPDGVTSLDVLAVGGGGGGGSAWYGTSGGGGGGQVVVSTARPVTPGTTANVTVGAGGAGGRDGGGYWPGSAGASSSFAIAGVSVTAVGGAVGGDGCTQGQFGGGATACGAGGTSGSGNSGGSARWAYSWIFYETLDGGGGGGDAGAGSNAATNMGGNGGAGTIPTAGLFAGQTSAYGGGGGGGSKNGTSGTATAGGGNGSYDSPVAPGAANSGGGGGGSYRGGGGAGGSGVVVVRFINPGYRPTVTTGTATSIAATSATASGEVVSEGMASATERGIVYAATATNAHPTVGGAGTTTVADTGTGTGTFSVDLSGLTASTSYSFVAYATNSYGTAYGQVATFTSASKTNQTVSFTSTGPTNATVGGPTYTVTATASSGLPVTLSIDSSASSVCSLSGSTSGASVSFIGVGTCKIDANQGGNASYNAASQVQQSFGVGARLPAILYAAADGLASGTCDSWANACQLWYALSRAVSGDQIWASAGTYLPNTAGLSDQRSTTFQLKAGVAVYGGFAGTETSLDGRNSDPAANGTVLSGDIGVAGNSTDNAYHVVTGTNTGPLAILDGFTVTGGNANGGDTNGYGGGMYNASGASPTLRNLIFTGNTATSGGGMYNSYSSPTLTRVIFNGNTATDEGGGIEQDHSSPTLTDVTFSGNTAAFGGGIDQSSSSPRLTDVTFSGNSVTDEGGAMAIWVNSSPTLTNVTFTGNTVTNNGWGGGAISITQSTVTLTNVTFAANSAGSFGHGGGMFTYYATVAITNGIFWGNTGGQGPQIYLTGGTTTITFSDVQGGWTGTGNINADPLLGALGSYGDATKTLPLLPGSPAIDAANAVSCPATDQRGVVRPQGAGCDMGAFEAQPFSMSVIGGDGQSTLVDTAFGSELEVTVTGTGSDPVVGGKVSFTAPTSGPGATFTPDPTAIGTGGIASVVATANRTGGDYQVTAAAAGANTVAFSLTNIAKSTPTFAFDLTALPAKTYGDASFSVAGYVSKPADDAGGITFAVGSNSTGCSVTSVGMVTLTGAAIDPDHCIIDASLAADSTYSAAGPLSQSFNIARASLTITADDLTMQYGGVVPSPTSSYSRFANGETLATSGVTGSPDCAIADGPYTVQGNPYAINCTQGTLSAANYAFTFVDGALMVTPGTPNFTFDLSGLPSTTYGDGPFSVASFAATNGTSTGSITFGLGTGSAGCAVSSDGTVTVTGAAVDPAACSIAASLAADPNYAAAGPITQSFHIAKATPAFAAISISNDTYDGHPHAATADVSGVGDPAEDVGSASVSYELRSGTDPDFTYGDPTTTAPTDAGVYRVTFSYAGSTNYVGITDDSHTLTISPAATAISAVSATATYGGNAVLQATLTDVSNGWPVASKTISFKIGPTPVGTPKTLSHGVAFLYGVTVPTAYIDADVYVGAVIASFADERNYTGSSGTGDLTVQKADLTVTPDNASRQYSDPNPTFSGTITGIANSDDITATYATTATTSSAPGTYDIKATLVDPDNRLDNYDVTLETGTLTVTQEDARATYTGDSLFWGTSADASSATVTLTATIKDVTALTDDSAYDPFAGDISHATVTFVNRDAASAPLSGCSNLPVALVRSSDTTVGTVSCSTTLSISSSGATQSTIGIVVGGYYTDNTSDENAVIDVAAPLTSYFITGGGYLTESNSAGAYAADPGRKANFGFNVKFNKKATSLQGNLNILFRRGGHTYQIKSNALTSLGEKPSPCTNATATAPCTATFVSKANLQDITDPSNPVSLGGNLTFQMSMTDYGSPQQDTIGFTLYDGSGLLFSSNWNGTKTVEQLMGGGNLSVR